MKKIIIITLVAIITVMGATTGTAHASVKGITKDNYLTYEKKYADAYGYNKGECDTPYKDGEEYFYNDYYDHWNVEKVYDESLIPKADTVTNKGLVKAYCEKHYKTRTVKYTNYKPWRKSSKWVYVETIKSISDGGKHGHTKDGHYIRYNKSVKKGNKVTSYLIYNPKTKYIDDVVAVVDNKKIRP